MPSLEIVFDVNIWLRYILKAQLERLTELVFENRLVVYSSEKLISELIDVLAYSDVANRLTLTIERYVDFHRSLATVTGVNYAFRGCPDPKDDYLFDLALSAGATYLVTNDKILLGLGQVRGVRVISMIDFLKLIGKK